MIPGHNSSPRKPFPLSTFLQLHNIPPPCFMFFLAFIKSFSHHFIFKILFHYLFLDRGEGGRKRGRGEKERERNINVWLPLAHPLLGSWPTTQVCALTGNRTGNPVVRRPALTPLSHTNQGHFPIILEERKMRKYSAMFNYPCFYFI